MLVLTRKVGEAIVVPPLDVSIVVQSIQGRRVRLGVCAPQAIPVHREEVSSRINPQSNPELDAMPVEGVRILLADADASLAAHYETHLSRLGYEVSTAADGISCVARLRKQTPHLLVLDADLLWGRAEGVMALMQERADAGEIPVLVTYNEYDGRALPAVRPLGVCDYVAKPLTPEELAVHICELIAFRVENCERQR